MKNLGNPYSERVVYVECPRHIAIFDWSSRVLRCYQGEDLLEEGTLHRKGVLESSHHCLYYSPKKKKDS